MRGKTGWTVIAVVLALGATAWAVEAQEESGSAWIIDRDESTRAFLGVRTREEVDLPEGGARVDLVVPDSPASAAGIREGDVIVSVAGQVVRGPAGLAKRIGELEPGTKTTVEVVRDGRRESLSVELAESRHQVYRLPKPDGEDLLEFEWHGLSDEDQMRIQEDVERALEELERHRGDIERHQDDIDRHREEIKRFRFSPQILPFGGLPGGKPILGVRMVPITPELRDHYGAKEGGVLIGGVDADSPAARAGVLVGDVLVSIAGQPIREPADAVRLVVDNRGRAVALELVRDGRRITVEADLPEPEAPREGESEGPRAATIHPGPAGKLI